MTKNCVSPPELDDRQLLAYLDNREANPETESHLKNCAYCGEKAAALDRLQKRLIGRLYRFNCPSPLELGEYHLHMLPAAQMLLVRQHLSECPHCAREVAQLEEFLSDRTLAEEEGLMGKVRVLVARLVSGSPPGGTALTPAPALRGEGKGPLSFEADGILITLDVQPGADGRTSMLGQVAAEDQDQWTGAEVKIEQAGTPDRTVFLDDLGAFYYEEIISGSIRITITSRDGIELRILNIDIDV